MNGLIDFMNKNSFVLGFLIVLFCIYFTGFIIVFLVQLLFSKFSDSDQSYISWKLILKQSFEWPGILFNLIYWLIKK